MVETDGDLTMTAKPLALFRGEPLVVHTLRLDRRDTMHVVVKSLLPLCVFEASGDVFSGAHRLRSVCIGFW